MKALFTVQHPAHVHLFRNAIDELEAEGHDVRVLAREKDIALELLDHYGIEHVVLAGPADSLVELALCQARYEFGILRHAVRFDPDVMVAMGEPGVAHASSITGCPGLVFTDTEHATIQNVLAFPFADRICTPTCYQDDAGDAQVRYPGYHELAYLHPDRFTPKPDVLDLAGLDEDDSFTILRLNAWQAAHDLGDDGLREVEDAIRRLEATGTQVLVTSEPDLPPSLEQYEVDVPLHRMHDLVHYADLLIGESATMAAESAVLGTPAVFISTSRRGYTDELGDRYGLVFTFSGSDRQEAGLQKGISILEKSDDESWTNRREMVIADRIDTTNFILDQIRDCTDLEMDPESTYV